MASPTIKKVAPDDWVEFRRVRLEAFKNDASAFGLSFEEQSRKDEAYWRDRMGRPDRPFYVTEIDGAFVATAGARKLADEEDWMIVGVYVSPEQRRRGIAKALIERVIEDVRGRGAEKVFLLVNAERKEAVSLYESLGFEVTGNVPAQKLGDGQTHDEYRMEKKLAARA